MSTILLKAARSPKMCCLPYLGLLTKRTRQHYVQFAKFYGRFESCLKLTTVDVQV